MTNREFYLQITALLDLQRQNERTLEQYLLALWLLITKHRNENHLHISELVILLTSAFSIEVPAFNNGWRSQNFLGQTSGFCDLETTLLSQIVDLREIDEAGLLEGKHSFLELCAPRGSWWYNLTTRTYLECAAEGAFGGWQQTDATGRMIVPENSSEYVQNMGETTESQPEPQSETFELRELSWGTVERFVWCGQNYE